MIKILEKNVSDKIAAGEVIDRPVSIVKELVENSIDAEAQNITVEIRNGGKTFIRVSDDGSGIERNEAELAFLRHATSKIEKASDLDAIESLGFRGEALASIAAVTRISLITKTHDAPAGCRITIHGGEVIENTMIGCPEGTTLVVTDLFYNTPARKEFLKNDHAESGRIIDFMSEITICYPEIRFHLINNGASVFDTAGDGSIKNAILSVYRREEYRDLVEVDRTYPRFRVMGCISRPSLSRTTRRDQIFFINGRVVQSKVLERAVSLGYKERLFEGRYPVVFLKIETEPGSIDVNIHPSKREVRFHDEQAVQDAVAFAIRETLGSDDAVIEVRDYFKKDKADTPEAQANKDAKRQVDIKQLLKARREQSDNIYPEKQLLTGLSSVRESEVIKEYEAPEVDHAASASVPKADAPADLKDASVFDLRVSGPAPFDFSALTVKGIVFDTYIMAADSDAFYLIDQHAAHERVFYEQFVGSYLKDEKLSQPILTPVVFDVSPSLAETEDSWIPIFAEMGYRIENFGPNSYIIKEIPTFTDISEAERFVLDSLDDPDIIKESKNTVVIDKLITRSCKSAVKAHDKLSPEEVDGLISQLAACRNPFSCPHGRPTFIRFSIRDIERFFKRIQ